MQIQVYIYKRHDIDLLALADAGYSLSTMIKSAVCAYANEQPLFYYIDEVMPFDLNDKKSIRVIFRINKSDSKTFYMLNNIKHGKRGVFCKMILRNAIIQQNMAGFFADENLVNLHFSNLRNFNINMYSNVIPISSLKKNTEYTFLNNTITIDRPQAFVNPFSNYQMPVNPVYTPNVLQTTIPVYSAPVKNNTQQPLKKVEITPTENKTVNNMPVITHSDTTITDDSASITDTVVNTEEVITNDSNTDNTSFVFNNELFNVFDSL